MEAVRLAQLAVPATAVASERLINQKPHRPTSNAKDKSPLIVVEISRQAGIAVNLAVWCSHSLGWIKLSR